MTAGTLPPSERGRSFFLFTVIAYQYLLLASAVKDVRLGPASLQVTLATVLFVVCAILRRERVIALLGWQAVTILGLGVVFIPFKMLSGYLQPAGLQAMRLFFILPLLWAVYAAYMDDEATRRAVASIIIWNCVFIAVFGLVHFFVFPTVFLSSTVTEAYRAGNISLIPGHSQEAAFFGNPSGYGAILVTGLFAIYITRRNSLLYVAAFILIVAAVFLSISRSSIFFATLLLVLYLVGQLSVSRPSTFTPIAVVAVLVTLLVKRVPFLGLAAQAAAARMGIPVFGGSATASAVVGQLGTGRLPGYKVGLEIMFRDFSHIFFGSADNEELIIGDVNFSDNSFIFLALGFGIPLAFLWVVTVLKRAIPIRYPGSLAQALLLVFIYVTLLSTPSIGWDMWLVYAIGLLFISPVAGPDTEGHRFPAATPEPSVSPAQ